MATVFRQGDVLLILHRTSYLSHYENGGQYGRANKETFVKEERVGDKLVLAYGEQTGHMHHIKQRGAELLKGSLGHRFLQVFGPEPVALDHDEHGTITVPPGTYEVRQQTEWDGQTRRALTD